MQKHSGFDERAVTKFVDGVWICTASQQELDRNGAASTSRGSERCSIEVPLCLELRAGIQQQADDRQATIS